MAGEPFDAFFADEYALNVAIKRYPKPTVALVDGIAMGGGVGVAYHARHVVVGERARFAMPECSIGFFPDVGGTHLLSRLPGEWGRHLGLTGARLGAAEQVVLGLATDAVAGEHHDALLRLLAEGDEPGAALARVPAFLPTFSARAGDAHGTIAEAPPPSTPEDRNRPDGPSPTSVRVAGRQLALGPGRTFEACMGLEARIAHRMLRGHDFYEGIRAAVIDKGDAPRWSPAAIGDVTDAMVDEYFAPVESGPLAALSALAD